MKKFENVLIEKDTTILSSEFIKIQGFDCKHEVWKWDGIKAESLVFYKYDFDEPYEKNILKIVENYIHDNYQSSKHTIKTSGDYIFFNYNFSDE